MGFTAVAVLLARFLSLALFALSARALSQTENAGFIYITGVSGLVVHLGTLGWLALCRKMASSFDFIGPELAKGFLLRSIQIPVVSVLSICFGLLILAASGVLGPSLTEPIAYTAVASVPLLANYMLKEYLSGLGRPALSVFSSETVPLALAVVLMLVFGVTSLPEAVLCVIAGSVAGAILQLVVASKLLEDVLASPVRTYQTAAWSRMAAFTFVGVGGKLLMDRLDSLLLAPLAGLEQLAQYNSAVRTANLLLLMPVILLPVFAPRVSRAFLQGDVRRLRFEILVQLAIIAAVLVPAAIALIAFPSFFLSTLFGEPYARASSYMWLVVLSQVIFAATLPLSNMLVMTDGEYPYAAASVVGLLVNVVAGVLLIPHLSATGAAIASFIAMAAMAAILTSAAARRLGLARSI
ncbi:MATE family efflux transporter [Hyphomicrobium album]|uniref:MATE family efflux transporter n=1 Tax=Hyphomicrobium album TaxID=2665159 RepID=UPI0018AC1584|nr:polysaccharide biosynthesis C-terminal domain-containing protein [Hyphomicrobium album]